MGGVLETMKLVKSILLVLHMVTSTSKTLVEAAWAATRSKQNPVMADKHRKIAAIRCIPMVLGQGNLSAQSTQDKAIVEQKRLKINSFG